MRLLMLELSCVLVISRLMSRRSAAEYQQIVLLTHHAAVAAAAEAAGAEVIHLDPLPDLSAPPDPAPAHADDELRLDLGAVRVWARENGYDVGERGRIKAEVLTAYLTAHSEEIANVSDQDAGLDRLHLRA